MSKGPTSAELQIAGGAGIDQSSVDVRAPAALEGQGNWNKPVVTNSVNDNLKMAGGNMEELFNHTGMFTKIFQESGAMTTNITDVFEGNQSPFNIAHQGFDYKALNGMELNKAAGLPHATHMSDGISAIKSSEGRQE